MVNYKKKLSDLSKSKPKDKAVDLFWKLYPKNRPKKTWDSLSADEYPKPDIKQLKD